MYVYLGGSGEQEVKYERSGTHTIAQTLMISGDRGSVDQGRAAGPIEDVLRFSDWDGFWIDSVVCGVGAAHSLACG